MRHKGELYEDGILACHLLTQANLSEEQETLIRASTSKDLTYTDMEALLKRTFGAEGKLSVSSGSKAGSSNSFYAPSKKEEVKVKEEGVFQSSSSETDQSGYCSSRSSQRATTPLSSEDDENTFYFKGDKYQKINGKQPTDQRRSFTKDWKKPYHQNRDSNSSEPRPPWKKKRACYICNAEDHLMADCPERKNNNQGRLQFYQSDVTQPTGDLLSETVNKALLDTGASATVCGRRWLSAFEDSLTDDEWRDIVVIPCQQTFHFGAGDQVKARYKKRLPITICGQDVTLDTFVVEINIPLLMSRETMKEMKMNIDNERDTIRAFGGEEYFTVTTSGHMVIPIRSYSQKTVKEEIRKPVLKKKHAKKTEENTHRVSLKELSSGSKKDHFTESDLDDQQLADSKGNTSKCVIRSPRPSSESVVVRPLNVIPLKAIPWNVRPLAEKSKSGGTKKPTKWVQRPVASDPNRNQNFGERINLMVKKNKDSFLQHDTVHFIRSETRHTWLPAESIW